MTPALPIKDLFRYTFFYSVVVVMFFLFPTLPEKDSGSRLFEASNTLFLFYVFSLINILTIVAFSRHSRKDVIANRTKRYIAGLAASTLFMSFYVFLMKLLLDHGILDNSVVKRLQLHTKLGDTGAFVYALAAAIVLFSLVYFLHNFILLQHARNQSQLEISRLKSINAETANQLLRQQIHPHFLFNALNVLKSLIRKYPKTAEEYLIRLSDFLRTSITTNKTGMATVKEEVKLCQDYLEMLKIRFGNALSYSFDIPAGTMSSQLPFFSLQPLVENAIKHNELTDEAPLQVTVKEEDGYIVVSNNLQPKQQIEGSSGNGLPNLSERSKLLTGNDIIVSQDQGMFSVRVKLIGHGNRNH